MTATAPCFFLSLALIIHALPSAQATYIDVVLNDNPVAYWQFGDAASGHGDTATDTMGAINGVYQDGVTLVNGGIGGQAARFNGGSAGIDLGYGLRSVLDGATAISVEAWIRNDTLPTSTDNRQWIFATRIDGAFAGVDFGLAYDAAASPPDETFLRMAGRSIPPPTDGYQRENSAWTSTGQWRHVVGINDYENSQIRLFVDGSMVLEETVSFNAATYAPGATQSERDQIGRGGGGTAGHFDGLIDEVAVYNYALSGERILAHFNAGSPTDPPEPQPLWKSQVAFSDASTGIYLGSPSVARLDANTLVASHDYFGPKAPKNTAGWLNSSAIHRSTDNGESWSHATDITGSFWPTVFAHADDVYLIGESARYESIVIRKSTDGGLTWTEPTNAQNGLLRQGGSGFTAPNYFSGNNNMLVANGKIYRAFCDRTTLTWAEGYNTFIMWAELDSDLLDAGSWHATNKLSFPTGVFATGPGGVPGWQEGSVVQAPNGEIWNLLRVNAGVNADRDTAAIVKLSADGSTVTFDAATGFINLPGGSAGKFTVRRDPKTGLYLSLVNNIVNPEIQRQRNYLSLAVSEDLINWQLVATLLADDQGLSVQDSAARTGFQYVDWHFDGDDLVYIVRTAYDGAHDYHDSNRITYHVLENYESVITAIPEPASMTLFGLFILMLVGFRKIDNRGLNPQRPVG